MFFIVTLIPTRLTSTVELRKMPHRIRFESLIKSQKKFATFPYDENQSHNNTCQLRLDDLWSRQCLPYSMPEQRFPIEKSLSLDCILKLDISTLCKPILWVFEPFRIVSISLQVDQPHLLLYDFQKIALKKNAESFSRNRYTLLPHNDQIINLFAKCLQQNLLFK